MIADLEKRRRMAEFAGWNADGAGRWEGAIARLTLTTATPNDGGLLCIDAYEDFGSFEMPRYETDPAAACSLLPKLLAGMESTRARLFFMGRLVAASEDGGICELIHTAVCVADDGPKPTDTEGERDNGEEQAESEEGQENQGQG